MAEQVLNQDIGVAIGRIPSGVFVITTQHGESKFGMLASWVMQTGFEPPSVSVAIHPDREIYQAVKEAKSFSINVLSSENNALMKAFAKYSPDQFDTVASTPHDCGITLNDAVAVMHCKLKEIVPAGDHHLFIAEVVDAAALNGEASPMIHLRKSGFNY